VNDKQARRARDDRIRALLAAILELWPIPPPAPIDPDPDYSEMIERLNRENLGLLDWIEGLDSEPPPDPRKQRKQ
jgi:hypothetical protein